MLENPMEQELHIIKGREDGQRLSSRILEEKIQQAVADGATIDTSGNALTSENVGSATGGNITITAVSGATLDFGAGLFANAFGGIISGSLPGSAGSATGGNIDLLADLFQPA